MSCPARTRNLAFFHPHFTKLSAKIGTKTKYLKLFSLVLHYPRNTRFETRWTILEPRIEM
jgi:hypothetical protein